MPTYNERENVAELVSRLQTSLVSLNWEIVFVDDDSPDGTGALIEQIARNDPRIRLLRRVGRRGLSSACIEGVLATSAPVVAIMDADLQHDDAVLPRMFLLLKQRHLHLVVGTRNADGGSMGCFSAARRLLSHAGRAVANLLCPFGLTDPMSGFFLADRDFFLAAVGVMRGRGFKLLLDLLSASALPIRFAEVGYTFSPRRHGVSKLDLRVGRDFLALLPRLLFTRGKPVVQPQDFASASPRQGAES